MMLKPGDLAAVEHCPGVPKFAGRVCKLVTDNGDGTWDAHVSDGAGWHDGGPFAALLVSELAEWEKELLNPDLRIAPCEPNPYTSDEDCVADVRVTLLSGASFIIENVRVDHVDVTDKFLVMECMPTFPGRLVNIPLSVVAYWEQA